MKKQKDSNIEEEKIKAQSKRRTKVLMGVILSSILFLSLFFMVTANSEISFSSLLSNPFSFSSQATQESTQNSDTTSEWIITKHDGNEANFDVTITELTDKKKVDICFTLKEGVNPADVDLTAKYLYNTDGTRIKDNKNKDISLKYETAKCDGEDGYYISLSDAKAVNIDSYIKLGENSLVMEYVNLTDVWDDGFTTSCEGEEGNEECNTTQDAGVPDFFNDSLTQYGFYRVVDENGSTHSEYTITRHTSQAFTEGITEGIVELQNGGRIFTGVNLTDGIVDYNESYSYYIEEEYFVERTNLSDVLSNETITYYDEELGEDVTTYNITYGIMNVSRFRWIPYNFTLLDAGQYKWKVTVDKPREVEFDMIPALGGLAFDEWAWYNYQWTSRINLTINSSEVDETITDFPVYVNMSDLPANLHDNVNSDAGDIRITDTNGNELPREIVFYNATADTGIMHFKANISSSVDTVFYIYYGNSGASDYTATDTYGRNNVWTDYLAVYHLNEDASEDTDGYADATGNGHDGTGKSMTLTTTGILGGQTARFDGSVDYISMSDDSTFDNMASFTITSWVYVDTTPTSTLQMVTSKYSSSETVNNRGWYAGIYDETSNGVAQNRISLSDGSNSVNEQGTININDATWTHLAFRWNSTSSGRTVTWDDSTLDVNTDTVVTGSTPNIASSFLIGARTSGALPERFWDGNIQEIRFTSLIRSSDWISTEYNNQNSPSTFYSTTSATACSNISEWYDDGFSYRQKMTINSSQVDANVNDFPVYLDLSNLDSDFHSNVQTDGDDIRITACDGTTELPREVVFYNATADTGEVHFKVNLSSTDDYDFYVYYGNSTVSDYARTDTYGADNVWTNYAGVYHLQEDVNTDTNGYIDSSPNYNNGTGVSMSLTAPSGKLSGKAQDFDGTADYINLPEDTSFPAGSSTRSVQAWVNVDSNTVRQDLFSYGDSLSAGEDWNINMFRDGTGKLSVAFQNHRIVTDSNVVSTSTWTKVDIVSTTTSSSGTLIYTDGTSRATSTAAGSPVTLATVRDDIVIAQESGGSDFVNGRIDELRVYDGALTSTWISTEYNNQDSPTTFISFGGQEDNGGAPTGNATDFNVTLIPTVADEPTFNASSGTDTNVIAINQSSTDGFFNVTNLANNSILIKMLVNQSLTGITIKADDDNESAGAVSLSTSYQTVIATLTSGSSQGIWLWADFSGVSPDNYASKINISSEAI